MSKILVEIIKLKKTYKHFDGDITLFEDLNIKIKKGDLVALVGPSGSGKSSLLHLLALLNDFNAIENVMMPLIIKGNDQRLAEERAKKILKSVQILERSNHFPNELSGGEQQRVAIARALIAETDLILADEPTGNLDYKNSKEIFSYFLKLKKLKKTIIFATHNRELANRADYKLFISNGIIKRVNA